MQVISVKRGKKRASKLQLVLVFCMIDASFFNQEEIAK